jgi:uncharacterized repeat protein (TIGR03803 family)
LYSFKGRTSGGQPDGSLLAYKGALYGTTSSYGKGYGTVFALEAFGKVRVLHQFGGFPDGAYPQANLVALRGVLYGTTSAGGTHGGGTVFAITTPGNERVVHDFGKDHDGAQPEGGLMAYRGVLYGTTQNGGAHNRGIVFAMTPSGQEQILHSFAGAPRDGGHPTGALIAVNGDFYGTTRAGGKTESGGSAFKISPFGNERVVHSFGVAFRDGKNPAGTLVYTDHTLFGTTLHGGAYDKGGTIFAMTPGGGSYLVLHSFGKGDDGAYPAAGLIAVKGELYGTTMGGGDTPRQSQECISPRPYGGYTCGTIFKVNEFGQEHIVYRFKGDPDGANPQSALVNFDGVLYGTTSWGGSSTYYGSIFRVLHRQTPFNGAQRSPQRRRVAPQSSLDSVWRSGSVVLSVGA